MTPGKVLIVGAGTAGSAAAWHLHHCGWDVTLADASHEVPESYLLQLDQTAQALLSAMHAEHVATDHAVLSPRMSFRWGGSKRQQISISSGQARLGSRRDIVEAMRAHVPPGVIQRIGSRLSGLHSTEAWVTATFDDGTGDTYDIVVGADGLHSTVRRLTHGAGLHRNGVSHVWFKATARLPADLAVVASRRRVALQVYPYPCGDTTLVLAALELPADVRPGDVRSHVVSVLSEIGIDLRPVARALRAGTDDPFITSFAQVRLPSWSSGRTVLIGDAAHCIDPLSGLGAHAALLDATNLADSLQTHATVRDSFTAFEARTRPFVTATQALTARTLEYVTRPRRRSRVDTLVRGAVELARLSPLLANAQGRRDLAGTGPTSVAIAGPAALSR